ncbi:MAG TPA: hypothetical protein VMV10_16790 [Pirellulales bacterium]|nr:hypothetical protein [Pirellulales bacterium]
MENILRDGLSMVSPVRAEICQARFGGIVAEMRRGRTETFAPEVRDALKKALE